MIAAPLWFLLNHCVMVPWQAPPQVSGFFGRSRFFASRRINPLLFALSESTARNGWCQETRYFGSTRLRNRMMTRVSLPDFARGPEFARCTHFVGKFRLRSTWPLIQRRSLANPSGFSTGTTQRSTPLIGLPSRSPRATYCPKFSSPCMVATTITTGLPGSPARYATMDRPSADRPMLSLWYQVFGPVAAFTAFPIAVIVLALSFPLSGRSYFRCTRLMAALVFGP